MSCSPARLAANRLNALKSTGPKSESGKAVSRLNAFRHGMAGGGDLICFEDDTKAVANRALAFESELGASCPVGRTLANRAALLSIRMERAARRDMVGEAERAMEARDRFDRERLDEVDRQIEALEVPSELRAALSALEDSPEGVVHLLGVWEGLREAIGGLDNRDDATDRALTLLGPDSTGKLGVLQRVVAEVDRLRVILDEMTPLREAIADARDRAGLMAGFDPSPKATLARRYEAAAERGMYRAIRAIAEIRRGRRVDQSPIEVPTKAANPAPTPLKPPERPVNPPQETLPLGSFRVESFSANSVLPKSFLSEFEPSISLVEPRKKRPDLRKFAANRR